MLRFICLLLISIFLLSSCSHKKGIILFNEQPICKENALKNDKVFSVGQRVYYLFIAPERIDSSFIRVQVFKMTDKAPWGGNEVLRTKDFRLMKDERYYHSDYFTFYESGRYVMQIFTHNSLQTPIAIEDFYVK